MKAISLWQPWASAIALGLKKIETRSWSTAYRGRIAIHAAQKITNMQRDFFYDCMLRPEFRDAWTITTTFWAMPFGAVVATADLVRVDRTSDVMHSTTPIEYHLGDYFPGRFAWILENVVPLPEPFHVRGRQGLFEVTLPQPLEAA